MGLISKFLVVVALVGATSVPMAQAETLADALIAAYRNSNLLDQNRALLRAADEDVATAVADLRPVINFTAQSKYSHADTTSLFGRGRTTQETFISAASLTFDLTLLDFGRTELAIKSAKETMLGTREALIDVEQKVLSTTVQSYVQVRLSQEIVGLRQNNVRLITEELRAANDRFDVGEVTRTDVAIAESRLAAAKATLAVAQGDLTVAREAYKAATGAYPGKLAPLPPAPKIPNSLADALAVALRSHPVIHQVQYQVSAAETNVARAEAAMRPTLSARATIGDQQAGYGNESLALTLNQTIYSGGKFSALYRRALASRDAARAALHQAGVTVGQNVGNAWSSLDVSAASIVATGLQITASQTAYDGLREEAKLGARTTLDVLNAEQELLNARSARLSAEATRYFGVYSLLQSMGLLTVDHLGLGIPTYDVASYFNAVKSAPATSSQGRRLDRILKTIGSK